MQSEEPTIIQSLENHLAEYGHTTVGQDIAAAILVIKDLHQKAALSAAEPVAELQSVDARELDEAIKLLPSVMRPSLSKVIISAIEEQRRIISYFQRTSNARQLAFDAALSAQVQDVAGWQDISTAPQDGTTFLAIMAKAYSPRATLCKVEDGKFFSPSQGEKFVVPGWNQWWPTHWMPLPAAPAKLWEMLLDKSEDGQSKANWQGGRVNGIAAAISALSAQVQDVAEPDFSYRIEYDYRSYVEKKTMWGLYRELGVVALEEAQEALRTAQQNNAVNFRISRKPVVKWEPLPAAPAKQEGGHE